MRPGAEPLEVEDLSVRLGGRWVVEEVGLVLRPGEVTAVMGPNGAGKSTLLACLAGVMAPTRGRCSLGGRGLLALPPRERARRIALLAQTPEIAWDVDVETLVGLGRLPHRRSLIGGSTSEDADIVAEALRETGTLAFARRSATRLSGGERARVLLARALAGQPEWLLADEPLAGLDPGHQFEAVDLLRRVAARGPGVVVTLHDLGLAARAADRIVLLRSGRVTAEGPPKRVLSTEVLAEVYGVEARVVEGEGGLSVVVLGPRPGAAKEDAAEGRGRRRASGELPP